MLRNPGRLEAGIYRIRFHSGAVQYWRVTHPSGEFGSAMCAPDKDVVLPFSRCGRLIVRVYLSACRPGRVRMVKLTSFVSEPHGLARA